MKDVRRLKPLWSEVGAKNEWSKIKDGKLIACVSYGLYVSNSPSHNPSRHY